MSPARHRNVESIFHAAIQKDAPALRKAFLEGACGEDPDLRAKVDALIRAHDEAGSFLEAPALAKDPLLEGPGTLIGPYKLLQLIGEGGMGAVYMAEQQEPVRRKVALKIIKLGMDTKQVIARFEAERQALAMTDHPNIAKVLDAGATETGRPYFVMELVRGINICDYCDKNNLSTRERLLLFVDVCHAVQHAHMKGLIHRDIKPTNVMVTLHDGKPVPKIIDFGIAKATSQRLTEKTVFTEYGQFIGTPAYMSPEQAEMSGLDVDTRTDIYALGVLLYELLTGSTPFDPKELKEVGFVELQRIIRERDPEPPSTRVSTLGDALEDVAGKRRMDPSALRQRFRGDLDWIVMRALEKDRTRRYETADSLAKDIERHLANEPVQAGPPGALYRMKKFVRRHRVAVLAGGAVTGALLTGLALAVVGMIQASNERDIARVEKARADQEAARSKEINAFLQDQLVATAPEQSSLFDTSVEQVVARCRELFGEDHAIVGGILYSWAANLRAAGKPEDARAALVESLALYERAYGPDHQCVANAVGSLASVLGELGEHEEAEAKARKALALNRKLHGERSPQVAEALQRLTSTLVLADSAERAGEVSELWHQTATAFDEAYGRDSHKAVSLACERGAWLFAHNRREEAESVLVEAVERGRTVLDRGDPNYFEALSSLANLYVARNDLDVGRSILDELAEAAEVRYGAETAMVARIKIQIAAVMRMSGAVELAEPMLQEASDLAQRVLPPGDIMRFSVVQTLAQLLVSERENERAKPLYALAMREAHDCFGEDNPRYIGALSSYASWLREVEGPLAAEPVARAALESAERALPAGDATLIEARESLLDVLEYAEEQEGIDEYCSLAQEQVVDARTLWGTDDPRFVERIVDTASYFAEHDRRVEALELLVEASASSAGSKLLEKRLEELRKLTWQVVTDPGLERHAYELALTAMTWACEHHPANPGFLSLLGAAHHRLGDQEEATRLLGQADQIHSLRYPGGLPSDIAFLAMAHYRAGRTALARDVLGRVRNLMQSIDHADDSGKYSILREAEALIEAEEP